MRTANTPQQALTRLNPILLVGVFIIVAAVLAVPVYSVRSSSLTIGSSQASVPSGPPAKASQLSLLPASNNLARWSSPTFRSLLPLPQPSPETIATFAADCTTPQTSFVLGETVCAQTDGVDLGFPLGRWVHWLRPDLTIAYGGNGITDITVNPQTFSFTPDAVGTWKVTIAETGDISQTPAVFTVVSPTPPIATYAANCTTPKTLFNLGDIVCARAQGFDPAFNRRFAWVDPAGLVRRFDSIISDPQTNSFTLPATETSVIDIFVVDNRGTWKVNVVTSRGSQIASAPFNVQGASPRADLSIGKGIGGGTVDAGNDFSYTVAITNFGPNPAEGVVFTDPAPPDTSVLNATFVSVNQTAGPTFSCEGTAPLICTLESPAVLIPGESAVFELTYTASGAPGSTIANTARVSSTTTELNETDNTTSSGRVTISDNGGPAPTCSLECPNDISVATNTAGGATVSFDSPDTFGDCGTVTYNHASGSFFAIGTTTVTATSTTGGGSCSFTVTVIDSPNPTITCPVDQTVAASNGQIEAAVMIGSPTNVTPTGATVTGHRDDDRALSDPYPVGETEITWTATDSFDRVASCVQRITVTSPDAPTISCPTNKTFTTADCSYAATAAEIETPVAGGSGVVVTSRRSDDEPLTAPFPAGTTAITWTATDAIGRVVSCTQIITVNSSGDSAPPTLHIPADISVTTTSCSEVLDDELGVATAEDSCSAVSITRTGVPTFSCPIPGNPTRMCESFVFPTGTTNVTYTATDGSGNVTTGVQHVTVHESPDVPPSFTFVPTSLTLNTGPGATSCGTFVGDATLGTATASDNCPGVTVTRAGVPAGNNFPVGSTTITYTATDASGNTVQAIQQVTVVDNTPPTVTPPAAVTLYTGSGATSCGVTVSNLDSTLGTGSASDNCAGVGAVTRSGVPAGNVFPVGQTTLTYSATDAHGNTSSATQVVTVVDNTPPTLALTGANPMTVECHTGFSDPGATANDNCAGDLTSAIVVTGSVNPNVVGDYALTYTVNDGHGNTTTATRLVEVRDTTPPVITLNGQTPSMWPPNHKYHTFGVTGFVTGVTDSCDTTLSVGSVVIEKVTSDEIENGNGDGNTLNDIVIAADCKSVQLRSEREGGGNGRVYTIFFKVTDASGNVGTATAKVVVQHNPGGAAVDSGVHYTVYCGS